MEAEAAAPDAVKKRRIDLLIQWSDSDSNRHCVVAEAKFSAPVSADALAAYSRFAVEAAGSAERVHLFLISAKQHLLNAANEGWRQVTWFSLLRHWERRLAVMPPDEDFFCFSVLRCGKERKGVNA